MFAESPLSGLPAQSVASTVTVWVPAAGRVLAAAVRPIGEIRLISRNRPVVCVGDAWSRIACRARASPNARADVLVNVAVAVLALVRCTVAPGRETAPAPGRRVSCTRSAVCGWRASRETSKSAGSSVEPRYGPADSGMTYRSDPMVKVWNCPAGPCRWDAKMLAVCRPLAADDTVTSSPVRSRTCVGV